MANRILTLPARGALLWAAIAVAVGFSAALLTADAALLLLALIAGVIGITNPRIAAIALFIIAPMRTLIATEAPGLLPFDVGQAAFGLLILSFVLHKAIHREVFRLNVPPLAAILPLVCFLAASGLSLYTAYSAHAWLTEWVKWLQILALILILYDLAQQYGWRWIVFGLVCAALANALIGIYQFYGGSGALHLLIEGNRFRAFGTFGQPNPFGGFMGLIAPLALLSAYGGWHRLIMRPRHEITPSDLLIPLFYTIAGAAIAYALYVSYSRGAWLGFAASAAVMALALPRRLTTSIGIVAAGVALVGVALLSGRIPASITARLSSITDEIASAGDVRGVDVSPENYANVERLAHWQAAIGMADAQPWTGVGFGNYEVAYFDFALLNWDFALGHAHNYYLNVLGETGMIGLIAYAALMLTALIGAWRLRVHSDRLARCMGIALLGSWVYLSVHSLTDNLYVNNLFFHVGALFALCALLRSRSVRAFSN